MNKIWSGIIVILLIVGAIWWLKGSTLPLAYPNPTMSASPTASPKAATAVKPKVSGPVATPLASYSQLVAQFGNRRIQFDMNCQAVPKAVVYKNGTSILLDNRANQARSIGVDSNVYNLGPYGYQVVTLSGSPHKIGLSCNKLVNVGTIQLEAAIGQ